MPGGASLLRPSDTHTMNRDLSNSMSAAQKLDVSVCGLPGELFFNQARDVVWRPGSEASACQRGNCCRRRGCKEGGELFAAQDLLGASLEPPDGVRLWSCPRASSSPGQLKFKLHKSERFECSDRIAAERFVEHVQREVCWRGRQTPPRVVAVVNPTSGRGKGASIFSNDVLPLLRNVAGLSVEVHATTSKHHATQIVRDLPNIDKVDSILYVGGDGTVFEGLQGLLSRPDWAHAATVPFATCPTGSGNGLAASLGVFDPVAAAYTVVRHNSHPIDVASVLQPPGSRYYLLLSLAYGLMSNLDIGTEYLRWMGEPRFSYGGLCEILSGRSYPLRAAVWPGSEPVPEAPSGASPQGQGAPSLASSASPLDVRVSVPPANSAASTTGEGGPAEEHSLLRNGKSIRKGKAWGNSGSSSSPGPSQQRGEKLASAAAEEDLEAGRRSPMVASSLQGPPLPILSAMGGCVPASMPTDQAGLPPGWQMLPEEETSQAQYFMAHNTQYIALKARANPQGMLSDGMWELITAQAGNSCGGKLQGLQMLLGVESGDHVGMKIVKTTKMRAMMLEPLSGDQTWTVVDGEAADNVMTYLEVHPQLCRALVAPGWVDQPKS